MKIELRYLALGLVALFGSLLASSQGISAYQMTDRPSALPATSPIVPGTGKTLLGTSSVAPRSLATNSLYLPLLLKSPPSIATPGYWLSENLAHEFYVTPDAASVKEHSLYFTVCGGSHVATYPGPVTISVNRYSFTGPYYASGTFNSATTATVTDGLSNFYVSGCGYVNGGPWTRNYYWVDSSQPALAARVVGPEIDSFVPADHAVEVIKVH